MNFDKKVLTEVAGVLVFTMLLGTIAFGVGDTNATMIVDQNMGINSSAGVNNAINHSGSNNVAGATGAVDEYVGVIDVENTVVGQAPQYDTFGYTNLGLVTVKGNLNIRDKASKEGKVVGKMTNYAACEILGEENGFYKIKSGNAEGYISSEYVITGEEALIIAQTEAKEMATVTTTTLRVREKASTDSTTLSTVSKGEDLVVIEKKDGWLKVEVDDYEGYVSSDYVTLSVKLKTGNTLKELSYGQGVSDTRVNLVNYALQFVGNRYVWGGESLTKGVDCSGFTMKVYQKFGVKLPHYSVSQPSYGKKIKKSELQPGDLIFYGENGKINHVAIYIGNGKVVHAANKRDGIKISNAFYRKPICYRSYLN